MSVCTRIETIGPTRAAEMLANNIGNRGISPSTVARYAKAMADGKWKFNGESIKFAASGKLIDGQHRLHAVVRYGKPVQMMVVTGLQDDAFDSLDIGKRRSAGDVLSSRGVQNSNCVAGALRFVAAYDSGNFFPEYASAMPTTTVLGALDQYPKITEAACHARRIGRMMPTKMIPPAVLAGLLFCCGRASERRGSAWEDGVEFFELVATGRQLENDHPAYTLRERLIRISIASSLTRGEHVAVLCVRAWNAHAQGRSLAKLQLWGSNESRTKFPSIY